MKQRRFEKAFEIELAIIAYKKKAKQKLERAVALEVMVKDLVRQANSPAITPGERQYLIEQADFERKNAIKLRRSVELIYENRIPQLGRTLAAFNTQPMAFVDDASINLQK